MRPDRFHTYMVHIYGLYMSCTVRSSRAEDDTEAPVAGARFGPHVIGLVVRVIASRVPAPERHAGAAGEVHGDVVPVDHRDVIVVLRAKAELRERGWRA